MDQNILKQFGYKENRGQSPPKRYKTGVGEVRSNKERKVFGTENEGKLGERKKNEKER